jgi:hypothetical protein
MAQIVRNVPDGGLDEPPGWEAVTPAVDPLPVPGGWIYRTDPGGVVFVPDRTGKYPPAWIPAQSASGCAYSLWMMGGHRRPFKGSFGTSTRLRARVPARHGVLLRARMKKSVTVRSKPATVAGGGEPVRSEQDVLRDMKSRRSKAPAHDRPKCHARTGDRAKHPFAEPPSASKL